MKELSLYDAVEFLKSERIIKKDTEIAIKTGYSKQTISNYISGKQKPSKNFIDKFSEVFNLESIDTKILVPKIIVPDATLITKTTGKATKKNHSSADLIPYYDIDFVAGNSIDFADDTTILPEYYMDIPEFRGCVAFRTYSDSMEKLIKSGSVTFGRKITEWREHLEYGQAYGIVMNDRRRYLKYIKKSKEDAKNNFLLVSENAEKYDDFEIPKNKIHSIWLIEGWLNKNT